MAALKHVLEQAHSPLLGALMASLAHVLKDYRPEIEDILASNRQLAAELEFDLRQQEAKEVEAAEAAAAADLEQVQKQVARDLAHETGASVRVSARSETPHKDAQGRNAGGGGGGGMGAPAPGSVMKKGVLPPCFMSPHAAAKGGGRPATPLSIPRLAKAGAAKAAEEQGDCGRGGRARRRSSKEDSENMPVQQMV